MPILSRIIFPRMLAALALTVALAGCESAIDFKNPAGVRLSAPTTAFSPSLYGPPGGVAPPHGRTAAERAAANRYYSGPRGEEF